jgi:integrase
MPSGNATLISLRSIALRVRRRADEEFIALHRPPQVGNTHNVAPRSDLSGVFRREDGSPVHPDLFSQAFEGEVRRSGLPRIRLHDLRHTHATIALRAGVPVKVISERLGHEHPAFTMKQYAHVIPGMQAEAAALVASLLRDSSSTD